uniref:odorant receptor Or1-like n=1 Tax=Anopheles coluzzii TaxID=1518534 RepID=UPI0020FF8412|nr:odorant receptor Or1-like [Anopheles coluzzii]
MVRLFFSKTRVTKLFTRKDERPEMFLPSLRMILFIFRMFYAWPDEHLEKSALWWYRAKGVLFRVFFIYLSAATQLAYNFTVTSREELFAGMFVLLTQLVMILKMEFFYKNVSKIQQLIRRLNGKLYQSRNAEEDIPLASASKKSTIFWVLYFMFSDGLVTEWLVISLLLTTLIVPVWPGVDHTTPYWVVLMVILYQYMAIVLNASFNISWDSLVAALLALTNAHLHRLQIQLLKVGHQNRNLQVDANKRMITVSPIDDDARSVPPKSDADVVYNELLQCIIFHQEVTGFLREVLTLFSGPMLSQLYCSVFILCITEFRLLTDVNTMADTMQAVMYLVCLVIQVVQYCYFGNEINYMAQKVHQATAFVNYPDMNIKTRKLLIAFQQITARGIKCSAKYIFTIELSMQTFVTIIKTSYSYLAVLRSMTD